MRPLKLTLGDCSPAFPAGIYEPEDLRDANDDPFEHSETLDAVGEGPTFAYRLDYLPARFPIPTVTVGGVSRVVVPFNADLPPSPGQVAICFEFPLIQFSADDDGLPDPAIDYWARGSDYTTDLFNTMQKEIVALEEEVIALRALVLAGTSPGGVAMKSTDFTPDSSASVYLCDGNLTITLDAPPPPEQPQPRWVFKNVGAGVVTVMISGSIGACFLDSATSYDLAVQFQSIEVVSDGSNYYIIG